jgi:putative ABC transport system substrate-binding protein
VLEHLKTAAPSMSVELKIVSARTPQEFSTAFTNIKRSHAQALYVIESPLFYGHRRMLAAHALAAQLPTIYATKAYVADGGLMSYGADYAEGARRAAVYVKEY